MSAGLGRVTGLVLGSAIVLLTVLLVVLLLCAGGVSAHPEAGAFDECAFFGGIWEPGTTICVVDDYETYGSAAIVPTMTLQVNNRLTVDYTIFGPRGGAAEPDDLVNRGRLVAMGETSNLGIITNDGAFANHGPLQNLVATVQTCDLLTGVCRYTLLEGAVHNHGVLSNTGVISSPTWLTNTGSLFNTGFISTSGLLENTGVLSNSSMISTRGLLKSSGDLMNTGYIAVGAGLFQGEGTVLNAGNLAVAISGTLESSGVFTNAGFASLAGVMFNLGALDNPGYVLNTGILINYGRISTSGLFRNEGIIVNAGTIAGVITGGGKIETLESLRYLPVIMRR